MASKTDCLPIFAMHAHEHLRRLDQPQRPGGLLAAQRVGLPEKAAKLVDVAPYGRVLVVRAAFADCLVANPPNLFTNNEDSGRYVSIVAAEPTFFDTRLKVYADSGAALYAGLYSALPTHYATTNVQVPGTLGLRYSFTLSKLDALNGAGFVTFRNRRGRGLVVTDDPTAAQRDSDYRYLAVVRIVNEVIDLVRRVGAPYTGKPVGGERRNALITDIQVALESLQRQGKLVDFNFAVRADIKGYLKGELDVELDLVPAFILRRMRITVSLRPTA
ncbi:MAG: DUF2586 family protein [Limnochordales bacterium]